MAHITLQEYCWLTDLIEKWRKLDPELQLPTYLYIVKRPHAFQKEGTILKIHGPFCSWPLEAPSKFIPVLNNLILYYYVIVSLNRRPVTVHVWYSSALPNEQRKKIMWITTKPTKWAVCPAKIQISLCICPVWSVFALHYMGSLGPSASSSICWMHTSFSCFSLNKFYEFCLQEYLMGGRQTMCLCFCSTGYAWLYP